MTIARTVSVETPNDLEIVVERWFDAPPDLLFDCYTKPELVRRWLTGAEGWSLETCEIDLRVGGTYRYVWIGPEEVTMGMTGLYHEIEPVDRLVSTEHFDDDFGMGKMLMTLSLIAEGDATRLGTAILFESKAQRDAAVATGMTDGMGQSFISLDALLAEIVGQV